MIAVSTHSESGGHAHNEDAFAVQSHPDDLESILCAVADGQGGQAGGGPAARLACEAFVERAARMPLTRLMLPDVWDEILMATDRAVADDPVAGFSTLVAFAVAHGQLVGASCGDSALIVAGAEQAPLVLTAQQHKYPAVGSGAALFMPFATGLVAPWIVLAMTDGVWKYAGWDAVHQVAARMPDDPVAPLRERAGLPRTRALQDDFTLAVLRSGDPGPRAAVGAGSPTALHTPS